MERRKGDDKSGGVGNDSNPESEMSINERYKTVPEVGFGLVGRIVRFIVSKWSLEIVVTRQGFFPTHTQQSVFYGLESSFNDLGGAAKQLLIDNTSPNFNAISIIDNKATSHTHHPGCKYVIVISNSVYGTILTLWYCFLSASPIAGWVTLALKALFHTMQTVLPARVSRLGAMLVSLTILSPVGLTTSYTGLADDSDAAVTCCGPPKTNRITAIKQVSMQIAVPSHFLKNCCKIPYP